MSVANNAQWAGSYNDECWIRLLAVANVIVDNGIKSIFSLFFSCSSLSDFCVKLSVAHIFTVTHCHCSIPLDVEKFLFFAWHIAWYIFSTLHVFFKEWEREREINICGYNQFISAVVHFQSSVFEHWWLPPFLVIEQVQCTRRDASFNKCSTENRAKLQQQQKK